MPQRKKLRKKCLKRPLTRAIVMKKVERHGGRAEEHPVLRYKGRKKVLKAHSLLNHLGPRMTEIS